MIFRTKMFPRVETALILHARVDLYALKGDSNGPCTYVDDGASRLWGVQKGKERRVRQERRVRESGVSAQRHRAFQLQRTVATPPFRPAVTPFLATILVCLVVGASA